MGHSEESGMSERDSATVERIIANTINETARGDLDGLAARIVAALAGAGYGIVSANGIEDTALGPQPFGISARSETKSSGWRSADLGASATLPLRSRLYPNSIRTAFCA
jgi:hypothetical protein